MRKPSAWRALANQGPIGQEYPALVEGEPQGISSEMDREMLAYMDRQVPVVPEEAFEPLPQEVKGARAKLPNGWYSLGAGGQLEQYDPSIFGQVRSKIRSKMWNR